MTNRTDAKPMAMRMIAATAIALACALALCAGAAPSAHAASKSLSSSKAKVTLAKQKAYTGKAIKPVVTVKYGKKKLKKNRDYKVTYKRNKAIGTAKVTVKGIGKYKGKKVRTFKIVPKKMKAPAITVLPGGKVRLSWSGNAVKASRIEVARSKSSSMSSPAIKKFTVSASGSGTLDAGMSTCWVAMRAVLVVKSKSYASAWTKPVKIEASVLAAADKTNAPVKAEPGETPVAPQHVHSWTATNGKYWFVDVEAYYQTVPDHSEWICNGCKARFMTSDDLDDHRKEYLLKEDYSHTGHSVETVYKRVLVPEQGHWEATDYEYRCSKCGEFSHVK